MHADTEYNKNCCMCDLFHVFESWFFSFHMLIASADLPYLVFF